MNDLTFQHFSDQNLSRLNRWHGETLQVWSVSDWGVAMAGEAGEVCDAIKKYNRILGGYTSNNPRQPKTPGEARMAILKEIGDTVAYLDLLAQNLNSSLGVCAALAFNEISIRENMPERV